MGSTEKILFVVLSGATAQPKRRIYYNILCFAGFLGKPLNDV